MIDLALNNTLFIDDIFTEALQEIDIIFGTSNTELLGNPQFGTNMEEFLWTITPTTNELRKYIEEKLSNTIYVSALRHSVDVEYIRDDKTYESSYLVRIYLYDDYHSVKKEINLKNDNE